MILAWSYDLEFHRKLWGGSLTWSPRLRVSPRLIILHLSYSATLKDMLVIPIHQSIFKCFSNKDKQISPLLNVQYRQRLMPAPRSPEWLNNNIFAVCASRAIWAMISTISFCISGDKYFAFFGNFFAKPDNSDLKLKTKPWCKKTNHRLDLVRNPIARQLLISTIRTRKISIRNYFHNKFWFIEVVVKL